MQLLGNLKIHFLALVLTVVAEFIGIKKLGPVVLLPLLYTWKNLPIISVLPL